MEKPSQTEIACRIVGDFVENAVSETHEVSRGGEVVRPEALLEFVDDASSPHPLREFTVLLKDGRVVAVRGHGLKTGHPHHPVFSIVANVGEEEVVIALFPSDDVSGIFEGEIRPDRKIA